MVEQTRVLVCRGSFHMTSAGVDGGDEGRKRGHFSRWVAVAVRRRFFALRRVWEPARVPAATERENEAWTRSLSHLSPHY